MAVNIKQLSLSTAEGGVHLYNYQYDQLNRLVGKDLYKGFDATNNTYTTALATALPDNKETLTYDANGNILSYLKNASTQGGKPLTMDNLTYQYNKNTDGTLRNNRLRLVRDAVAAGNYTEDIDDQLAAVANAADSNYIYDQIGNLIADKAEKITNIQWSVYGKILSITKNAVAGSDIKTIFYQYDAAGNRIGKEIRRKDNSYNYLYTWYVRDASGNTMAVYTSGYDDQVYNSLNLNEHHLYGSSRIGIWNRKINMDDAAPAGTNINLLGKAYDANFTRGNKFFELSNHLGNVLVTVSDKKFAIDDGTYNTAGIKTNNTLDGIVDYFNANVVTANDYYSFGSQMPGRKFSKANSSYRYGFNGQMKSPEIGENSYTAEYWEYDSRTGRRWNLDPKPNISFSPYATFNCNPIWNSDRLGDTPRVQMNGADYSLVRGKDNKLKYVDAKGADYTGKLSANATSVQTAFTEALKSGSPNLTGRANTILNSKFDLIITEDQFALTGEHGGGFDELYAYKMADGTVKQAKNTEQQPNNAVGAYISLTGFMGSNPIAKDGVDLRYSTGTLIKDIGSSPILQTVHEIFGHGWQAINKMLGPERIAPTIPLLGYPLKAEADAVTIRNMFAIHMGLPVQKYYAEKEEKGTKMTYHKVPWGFLLGTLNNALLNYPEPK